MRAFPDQYLEGELYIHLDRVNDWPDTGELCCMGVAVYGAGGCTCWEPVCEIETQEPHDGTTPSPAFSMCHDCAFRKGSPERTGADGYAGSEEDLEFHVLRGDKFYCHQGVRKILHYRHPSGMTVEGHPADFDWRIINHDGQRFPLKADGSPADICGGWCKWRSKVLANQSNVNIDTERKTQEQSRLL